MAKKCHSCGRFHLDDTNYCLECGAPLHASSSKPLPSVKVHTPVSHTKATPDKVIGEAAVSGNAIIAPLPPPPLPIFGGFMRPHIREGILSIVAGILILINAFILPVPGFFLISSAIFPFMAGFDPTVLFIVGLALGVIVLVGALFIMMGSPVVGAIIVFLAAVASLIAGGGFIAGLVIGVIASILLLATFRGVGSPF